MQRKEGVKALVRRWRHSLVVDEEQGRFDEEPAARPQHAGGKYR